MRPTGDSSQLLEFSVRLVYKFRLKLHIFWTLHTEVPHYLCQHGNDRRLELVNVHLLEKIQARRIRRDKKSFLEDIEPLAAIRLNFVPHRQDNLQVPAFSDPTFLYQRVHLLLVERILKLEGLTERALECDYVRVFFSRARRYVL